MTGPEESIHRKFSRILREVFGFHTFLLNQEEIIQTVIARRDTFAVMPTGG